MAATPIQVQGRWLLNQQDVPTPSNQVLLQTGPDSETVYIHFGHVNPPVFELAPGAEGPTPEQQAALTLEVVPVARLVMSYGSLLDLQAKIADLVKQIEALPK